MPYVNGYYQTRPCTAPYYPTASATWHAWTTTGESTTSAITATPWIYWVDQGTTTGSAATSSTTWRTWTNDSTSATTDTYFVTDYAQEGWRAWQPQVEQKKLTRAEQKAARKRLAEAEVARREREAEAARVLKLAEEQRQQAKRRAEAFLLAHLTDEQERAWKENRAIFVTSQSGKRYRLKDGHGGNMEELGPDGRAVRGFCVHVGSQIPSPDNVLAQKLALEHDEAGLLRLANSWPIHNGGRV